MNFRECVVFKEPYKTPELMQRKTARVLIQRDKAISILTGCDKIHNWMSDT